MTDVSPLRALRLRTPRLELRLGDLSELEALARVAVAGIHPPEEMPFAVAWTDASAEPGFVESFVTFHEAALDEWDPDRWTLNLLAFEHGGPVGSQGIGATRFAEEHVVETGSWLGAGHQGRGLGTEMRAAVLELAFRSLGAIAARSGGAKAVRGLRAPRLSRDRHEHREPPRGARRAPPPSPRTNGLELPDLRRASRGRAVPSAVRRRRAMILRASWVGIPE